MDNITIHSFNGIDAIYSTDEISHITSFTIVPAGLSARILKEKVLCSYAKEYGHIIPEPMMQVAFSGDSPSRDFSAGISLRNCDTAKRLRVVDQKVIDNDTEKEVITYLKDKIRGVSAEHHIRQVKGYDALECWNLVTNTSDETKILEFIDTFSISAISPFVIENNPDKILMHRIRNNWSGEGRKESLPVSSFNMEDSWSYFGYRMERFGQVGTMPARGFIPFVAMEDLDEGITWAAFMESPMSWQIEAGHHTCGLHLSGGIADYNFGHWRKNLAKGETFTTHKAFITAVKGELLDACNSITEYQEVYHKAPSCEDELPIIYNEYLDSNGNPTIETIKTQVPFCKECGVKYFVMDDGWFTNISKTYNYLGNWVSHKERFPNGLKEFSQYLHKNGMKAGVWYEFENVTDGAPISEHKELFHTKDGRVIYHENRLFLDFRNPDAVEYIADQVINGIKENNIDYIKVDYNENIGLGVDGAESLGEGLRQHTECVLAFYRRILQEVPNLILEICSSGGMRHEPLFISLGSMVSFSDLHWVPEAAVAACDLHRVMLPKKMQVWSVIREYYTRDQVYYFMAQGMLGRLCLSGNLQNCSDNTKDIIKEGCNFYQRIKSVIKNGRTISINTDKVTSLRHLRSAFSLTRISKDERQAVFYAFRVNGDENEISCQLPYEYKVEAVYGDGNVEVSGKTVTVYPTDSKTFATVVLLSRF